MLLGLFPAAGSARLLPALDTSSPHATMQSFDREMRRIAALLEAYRAGPDDRGQLALRAAVRRAAGQLLDMSQVPPATHPKVGTRTLFELADILLRLPEIPPATIPGAPGQPSGAIPSRWTLPGTEISIERISAADAPPDFRFSSASVARAGEFHAAVVDQPPLRDAPVTHWRRTQIEMAGPLLPPALIAAIPAPLRRPVLETPIWKMLASLAVVVAATTAVLAGAVLVRRSARHATPWRRVARWLSVPLLLALVSVGAHHAIDRQINLTGVLSDIETLGATLALYAAAAWAAVLVCRLAAETIIASPRIPEDGYDAHLLRLMARIAGFAAAAVLLVYGANELGLPALGVAAGLGIGGVALALASQSTVENLFGGISIFADRPFRVGDAIRFNEANGIVESIGPRSTRMRSADGTLTTVPNADIAKAHVTNLSMRNRFLFDHRVTMPAASTAAQVEALLAALRTLLAEEVHPDSNPLCAASEIQRRDAVGQGLPKRSADGALRPVRATEPLNDMEQQRFLRLQKALLVGCEDVGEEMDRDRVGRQPDQADARQSI